MTDSDVIVTTRDGDSFTGDLLLGADGVHSKVRQQMQRVATAIEPATLDEKEEYKIPCYFKCVFEMSKPGSMPEDISAAQVPLTYEHDAHRPRGWPPCLFLLLLFPSIRTIPVMGGISRYTLRKTRPSL